MRKINYSKECRQVARNNMPPIDWTAIFHGAIIVGFALLILKVVMEGQ